MRRRSRPSLGYVLVGIASATVGWVVLAHGLYNVHPILGIASLAFAAAMGILAVWGATGRSSATEDLAADMADRGRWVLSTGVIYLIVAVWAVIATVVAVVLAVVSKSLPLDQTGRWMVGLSMIVSWIVVIVGGSVRTFRWVRRR